MKRLHFPMLCLAALLYSLSLTAQHAPAGTEGMVFHHGTWSEVLAEAKAQNKLVFIDCYTDWCGPCKWMAANTMADPAVGAYYNTHFINYKLDMEKGEGPEVAKKYNVRSYPTFMYVNGDGELVHRDAGSRDVDDFIALGELALSGITPLYELQATFAGGEYDREWLYQYLVRTSDAGAPDQAAVDAFKEGMQDQALLEEHNWDIFVRLFERLDSPQFQYVMGHLADFEDKFGVEKVNQKLSRCYSSAMWRALRQENYSEYESIRAEMQGLENFEDLDITVAMLDLMRYQKELPREEYLAKVVELTDAHYQDDANALNNSAWGFYESVDDPALLEKAVGWAERSVELDRKYYNMDTYGLLLLKAGHKDKGQKILKEAIEIAQASGEDYAGTTTEMEKWLKKGS